MNKTKTEQMQRMALTAANEHDPSLDRGWDNHQTQAESPGCDATTRPELTFDGCGINGPDEYRTRVCTFTEWGLIANKYGPMFAKAPETRAAAEALAEALREVASGNHWIGEQQRIAKAALAQWEEAKK